MPRKEKSGSPLDRNLDQRPFIREVVVVEGKDDVAAVKRACHAHTIITSGLGISRTVIEEIRLAQAGCGVIVLTDPDSPGESIRRIINREAPGCKHAWLYRDPKKDRRPVGVEYATPEEILTALANAKATTRSADQQNFTAADIRQAGLSGAPGAQARRDWFSRRLGLGRPNGKQFLARLNAFSIAREDFFAALSEFGQREEGL